jgi:ketosteroid isomerase-like protein
MPSANVDLVRSIWAAWERGDYRSADWAHPDIEFVWADGPRPGTSRGLAGMAAGMRDLLDVWEGFRGDVEEFRDLDSERVLVLNQQRGRGKKSGLELGLLLAQGAQVFHVRDGCVVRIVNYWDRDRALADLGLETASEAPGMSNPVETLRRGFEAVNRGDLDGAVRAFSPTGVWDMSQLGVGIFRGRDEIRVAFEDWIGGLEESDIGLGEMHDLGNGVTFGAAVQRGRPTPTSGFVELRYPAVWTLDDGLVQQATNYTDIDQARAAAERLAQERE